MAKLSEEEKERRAANRRRKGALEAEADAVRNEQQRRQWAEQGMHLTRAELEAGVPCPGCGLPIIDGQGDRPPLMKLTDEERTEHEHAEEDFKARHPGCRSHRWSMSGSRTIHCGFCCPPPPLSERQIQDISTILASAARPDPAELDTWRLTLTCEHTINKTQHHMTTNWSASTVHCPECEQTRGVVISEKMPASAARRAREDKQLTTEVEIASRELDKHQKKAEAANRRLERLQARRQALHQPADGE